MWEIVQVYFVHAATAAAKLLQSCLTLCDPIDGSPSGSPSLEFSRQEHWSGLPFPCPMHESQKWKWSHSAVSDSCDPMDCSLPDSSVHGIFQARVLEWAAIAFSDFVHELFLKPNFSNLVPEPASWVCDLSNYTGPSPLRALCLN